MLSSSLLNTFISIRSTQRPSPAGLRLIRFWLIKDVNRDWAKWTIRVSGVLFLDPIYSLTIFLNRMTSCGCCCSIDIRLTTTLFYLSDWSTASQSYLSKSKAWKCEFVDVNWQRPAQRQRSEKLNNFLSEFLVIFEWIHRSNLLQSNAQSIIVFHPFFLLLQLPIYPPPPHTHWELLAELPLRRHGVTVTMKW